MHLKTRNVNTAFNDLVKVFHFRGNGAARSERCLVVQETSRNGDVLRIDEPVTVTYERPTERILFNAARDANPFALLYEALYMLRGRNDVAPLAFYTKQFNEYSDDGQTLNGSYGHRWRNARTYEFHYPTAGYLHTDIDQIDAVVNHLKMKPNSRRAVLQMWNVQDDLLKIGGERCLQCHGGRQVRRNKVTGEVHGRLSYNDELVKCPRCNGTGEDPGSKDVCCLAGEVRFRSPEGDARICDLARRFQTEEGFKYPVYSVDTTTGDQRICWMTAAWKTGVKPTKRITFDDGSTVRLTADHKVFRKTKMFEGKRCVGLKVEEVCVGDLCVGDRLLSELSEQSPSRLSPGGYRYFKRNVYKNTGYQNMVLEHREYVSMFETLTSYRSGKSIHHKNGNKLDNRIANLTQMDNSEHFRIGKLGAENPHCRMSSEQKAARGQKHSVSIRKRFASMTPEERSQEKLNAIARMSEEQKAEVRSRRSAGAKRMYEGMPPEVRSAIATPKARRTEEQWTALLNWKSSRSNHKIVSIEDGGVSPVYDFTVPGRHNAVLANGVVVHNCNLSVLLQLRATSAGRALDITVLNRSNDLIWGLLGANYVTFSVLQEYIAARLGVEVGRYHHVSNNLHAYSWNFKPAEWLADGTPDWYSNNLPQPHSSASNQSMNYQHYPLVSDPAVFEQEVCDFVHQFSGIKQVEDLANHWNEPFLADVAQPMMVAWACYKVEDFHGAFACLSGIEAPDWRIACEAWMRRRYERRQAKKGASDAT